MKAFIIFLLLFFTSHLVSANQQDITNKILNEYFRTNMDYEAFFITLKSSLLAGERERVASLNSYPVRVNYPTGGVYYDSKEEFLENYDKIVKPEMLERVKEQRFNSLFYNNQGMYIGFGDIWFTGICLDGESCKKVDIKISSYSVLSIEKK